MQLTDFDYELPKELIAQHPIYPRSSSRLIVVRNQIEHKTFTDIIDYLHKDDVLVLNETKVIPAKLVGKKSNGGRVEIMVLRKLQNCYECMIKGHRVQIGTEMLFNEVQARVEDKKEHYMVKFSDDIELEKIGILPTPPYVKEELRKDSDYQTVYAQKKGSLAAPTAGLHFTKQLLDKIKKKGIKIAKVCLHISLGTFLPVRDLDKHVMHTEYYEIDEKNARIINERESRLFAVGTTSIRVLESVADDKGYVYEASGETQLFIKPGYKFKTKIDGLVTNFHLPRSTLLMLVSAFMRREKILDAYKIAIQKKYRFYSFGDCMLLLRE